jgi:hypothetical protein
MQRYTEQLQTILLWAGAATATVLPVILSCITSLLVSTLTIIKICSYIKKRNKNKTE